MSVITFLLGVYFLIIQKVEKLVKFSLLFTAC